MNKQDFLDTILDLPAALREQLADEIYKSLDSSESGLNADWIVEANHLMSRITSVGGGFTGEEIRWPYGESLYSSI